MTVIMVMIMGSAATAAIVAVDVIGGGVFVAVPSPIFVGPAAALAIMLMGMFVGVDEGGCQAPLKRDRLFARRIAEFYDERHDFGGEPDVVDFA